jgi:hypothetical protein
MKGEKFSSGLTVKCYSEKYTVSRIELLESLARNRKVIHVGCADHIPLVKEKMDKGAWLHGCLKKVAERIIGLDIDSSAIEVLRNMGITDIYPSNIMNEPVIEEISGTHWDIIIVGEVIEHVNNPIEFLKSIKEKYGFCVDELVVTTPNAFRLNNLINTLKNNEYINSDHRYWFTPYTLGKLITLSGMEVIDFYLVNNSGKKNRIKSKLIRLFPLLNETIVMHARLK